MARLIGILVAIASLAACSSGVSNSGAGAAQTDCKSGDLNLICTMQITVNATSVNAYGTTVGSTADALIDSTMGTLDINVVDPLGTFTHIFQGITWQTYDVSFSSGRAKAPVLGQRRYTSTLVITLTNNTGEGTISIPIVDGVTKKEFRNQDQHSGHVFPYVVTVRATGTDFATGHHVFVVARTTIEIGDFTTPTTPTTTTTTTTGSTASVIDYRAGLLDVAQADSDASNVRWQ
jgi:hypothetical protein